MVGDKMKQDPQAFFAFGSLCSLVRERQPSQDLCSEDTLVVGIFRGVRLCALGHSECEADFQDDLLVLFDQCLSMHVLGDENKHGVSPPGKMLAY